MKDKVAATNHPRESRGTNLHSRHIPAEVKRAVWQRDGGRCAFVSRSGRRCTEDGFLEFHHVLPYAVGGEATVRNIELRCRAHNGYEAERALGRGTASVVRETAAAYVTSIIRVSPGELPNTTSPESDLESNRAVVGRSSGGEWAGGVFQTNEQERNSSPVMRRC